MITILYLAIPLIKLINNLRNYNIEIVQMIELLQSEIQASSQIRNKESQLFDKKAAIHKKYQNTYLRYIEDQQSRIDEQIKIQEQADRTHQQKMLLEESLRQLQLKLKTTQLQKFDLLGRCQRHQTKMERLRAEHSKNKSYSKQISDEKSQLKRKIAENETQNMKICLQNQQLRRRCEYQLQQVGNKQVNNNNDALIQKIQDTLRTNIEHLQTMESRDTIQIQFYKQNKDTQNIKNKQRVIQLELQIKHQQHASEMVRQQIQAERYVQIALTMKQQFMLKINQFRQAILPRYQYKHLQVQLVDLTQQNILLRQKLLKFSAIKEQMLQLYDNLSTKLKNLKEQDTLSLNKMNISSNRFEKGLDYRRHFIKERQSIVKRYSKYLQ